MNRISRFSAIGVTALIAVAGTVAFAQAPKDTKPTKPATPPAKSTTPPAAPGGAEGQPELPAGWTEADMQACMEAGAPGPMHEFLAKSVGVWNGKTTMWMAPGAEPVKAECIATYSTMMDGRFTKVEMTGDMPGMGPFNGFGIYGFDNVTEKFQATWICNCGTGIMNGVGELSSDSSTLTWTYTHSCPITKKETKMREIERRTGKDTITLESHGIDPKSGKEYKMMEVVLTRKPGSATAGAGSH